MAECKDCQAARDLAVALAHHLAGLLHNASKGDAAFLGVSLRGVVNKHPDLAADLKLALEVTGG